MMDTENEEATTTAVTAIAATQLIRRQVALDDVVVQAVNDLSTRDRERVSLRVTAAGITVAGDRVRLRGAIGVLLRLALEGTRKDSKVMLTLSRHVTRVVMSLQGRRRDDRRTPPGIDHVMTVIQLHGGRIYAETSSGSLRFLVELPVLERRRTRASALLVEQDLDHIAALTEILHQHGVLTDFATTGTEALQRIAKRPPDLLIVDEDLGDMASIELVDRARMTFPALPAIIVSSHRIAAPADHPSLAAGAMAYLRKPLDVSDLLHLIDHVQMR